jgi:hypothetical protein
LTGGNPLPAPALERLVRPRLPVFGGAVTSPRDDARPPAGDGCPVLLHGGVCSCRGAVTAEFAVALPAVIFLLALLLAGAAAGVTQLRLEEAARAGARAVARGDNTADIDVIVRRLAGQTAGSVVAADGEWISVTVSSPAPGVLGSLLPWTFSACAWARQESAQPVGAAGVLALIPSRAAG